MSAKLLTGALKINRRKAVLGLYFIRVSAMPEYPSNKLLKLRKVWYNYIKLSYAWVPGIYRTQCLSNMGLLVPWELLLKLFNDSLAIFARIFNGTSLLPRNFAEGWSGGNLFGSSLLTGEEVPFNVELSWSFWAYNGLLKNIWDPLFTSGVVDVVRLEDAWRENFLTISLLLSLLEETRSLIIGFRLLLRFMEGSFLSLQSLSGLRGSKCKYLV